MHLDERSSGRNVRPPGRTALAAMSDCSQPSRVSGCSRPPRYSSVCGSAGGCAGVREGRAEGGEQWVADTAVAGVVAAGMGPVFACEFLPQVVAGTAARGADRGGWPAHGGARPRWTAAWCARTATAAAAGLSVIPAAVQGFWRAGCEVVRRPCWRAVPATEGAASRGRDRYRRRCHVPSRWSSCGRRA